MSVAEPPRFRRAIAPVASKTRRWIRRYGLPALGAFVIVAWIAVAAAAPLLSPYSPATVDVTARLRPPSSLHWLGTDVLGRDVFTRLIYGARISLTTGIVVVLIGAIIGTWSAASQPMCAGG
jgi:peptide/nickel transport system permease protein